MALSYRCFLLSRFLQNHDNTANNKDFHRRLADIVAKIRKGDFESQIPELDWLIQNGKYVQAAHYYLGVCYLRNKELDKAQVRLLQCHQAKRFYIQSVYYLAVIAIVLGNENVFAEYINEGLDYLKAWDDPTGFKKSVGEAFDKLSKEKTNCPMSYWL